MNNRFSKPVAFNASKEQAVVEYVNKKRNFSGYVKKLIVADMKAQGIEVKPKKESASERLERLKREMKKPSDKPGGQSCD